MNTALDTYRRSSAFTFWRGWLSFAVTERICHPRYLPGSEIDASIRRSLAHAREHLCRAQTRIQLR